MSVVITYLFGESKDSFNNCSLIDGYRGVTRGGRGEVSPALFWKLEKSAPIWRKNALIVVIYGYNFSFKMRFLRVSRGKTRRFFPCGAFPSHVVGECLWKCPNSKKTPLPWKMPGVELFDFKNYKLINFFIWHLFKPIYDVLGVFSLVKTKIVFAKLIWSIITLLILWSSFFSGFANLTSGLCWYGR